MDFSTTFTEEKQVNELAEEPVYVAEVTSVAKECCAGHNGGDKFEINTHKTGGICGYCYHDLFPTLMNCCYDGRIPWVDPQEFRYECPDRWNDVRFRVTRKERLKNFNRLTH
jgi:uncharacterized repeat protein (TIGR04076 family)